MPASVRIVIDTNILVSAFLLGGNPEQVIRCVRRGRATLLYTNEIRDEIEDVPVRKFGWAETRLRQVCRPYWKLGVRVDPRIRIEECRDPDDNRVLECAVAGYARFIVTGDRDLLTMVRFRDAKF